MKKISSFQDLETTETTINKNNKMIIQRNSDSNIIVMSMNEYNNKIMKKDIIKKLKQSEKEIERGEGIDSDEFFDELKAKFGY